MTRPAKSILSASVALAMAAGVLLTPAQARAATAHPRTAAPAAQRIDPGELQQLLDQIVAAGAQVGHAAGGRQDTVLVADPGGGAGRPGRHDLVQQLLQLARVDPLCR